MSKSDPAEIFREVIGWAQAIHPGPVVLIGGAVRDVLMGTEPAERDLFYLGAKLAELQGGFARFAERKPRPFRRHAALAAEVPAWFGLAQVFASSCTTAAEILEETDWNISAFGFDGEILAGERLENIGPGRRLRLLKVSNPIFTLARGFDFSKRFNMRFDTADVVALCQAVASGDFKPPRRRRLTRRGLARR